jgi:hypothetical protein
MHQPSRALVLCVRKCAVIGALDPAYAMPQLHTCMARMSRRSFSRALLGQCASLMVFRMLRATLRSMPPQKLRPCPDRITCMRVANLARCFHRSRHSVPCGLYHSVEQCCSLPLARLHPGLPASPAPVEAAAQHANPRYCPHAPDNGVGRCTAHLIQMRRITAVRIPGVALQMRARPRRCSSVVGSK